MREQTGGVMQLFFDTCERCQRGKLVFQLFLMREAGNTENDAIIKRRMFDEHIRANYNVLGVFDDRDRVVEMWRSLGLTCFQVDKGNF